MKKELIHKYLSGTCTSREKNIIENWLIESSKNDKIMKELKQIWEVTPGKRIDVDSFQAWGSFRECHLDDNGVKYNRHEMNLNSSQGGRDLHRYEPRRGTYSRMITYSVAVAAVLLIAFAFYNNINTAPTENSETELVRQEISTEKGQQTTVRLSDGTRIRLNAESKLSVPGDYMDKNRVVYLEGEAFFEVESNKDRPFIIHTSESVTRVLGTKFNVTAYPGEEKVQVVVAEGKVALGSGEESEALEVQLTKNQKGIITTNGEVIASNVSNVGIYLDWSEGRLTFLDTPLKEVEERLERWYDIEVIFDNDILTRNRLLTGTFKDVPLTSVLNSIALSLDINYKRDGQKVHFCG